MFPPSVSLLWAVTKKDYAPDVATTIPHWSNSTAFSCHYSQDQETGGKANASDTAASNSLFNEKININQLENHETWPTHFIFNLAAPLVDIVCYPKAHNIY